MEHVIFFDGTSKKIAWIIQTNDTTVKQKRDHSEIYLNKVTTLQSKYIALHVGIFWGIGTFIINNEDSLTVKIDEQLMFDYLSRNKKPVDEFIQKRSYFIKQLINQRKLKIHFELIDSTKNIASKLL